MSPDTPRLGILYTRTRHVSWPELNLQPFGYRMTPQAAELHRPGPGPLAPYLKACRGILRLCKMLSSAREGFLFPPSGWVSGAVAELRLRTISFPLRLRRFRSRSSPARVQPEGLTCLLGPLFLAAVTPIFVPSQWLTWTFVLTSWHLPPSS